MRLPAGALLLCLAGCSAKYWQDKQYAGTITANPNHRHGAKTAYFLSVLDGLARLLYTEGFDMETNGPDPRSPTVFTQDSSFRDPHPQGFDCQTTFVIVEAPTQEVSCVVNYTSDKEVYVRFYQNRVTSVAKPRFPMSAVRKSQIDRLVGQVRVYLKERLPGYHVTVSPPSPSA